MKHYSAIILGLIASAGFAKDANQCIAPNSFIELTAQVGGESKDATNNNVVPLGMYERVSPDGRFVLRSYSGAKLGNVTVMELPAFEGQVLRAYRTPLHNEAFPVQGTWRYLVDIDGTHYRFKDVLQQGEQAPSLFKGGMTGFYAAAAELPGAQPGQVLLRSLSWPNASGNDDTQGQGTLSSRTLTVDTQQQKIVADSGVQYLCRQRMGVDGAMYALPMISVDGKEFSAMPQMPMQGQQSMRIYAFGEQGKGCTLRDTFTHASSKTIFGFDNTGKGADLAFEFRGQPWWYNRQLQQYFNVAMSPSQPGETWQTSAFPGLTRDGRLVYAATQRVCGTKGCTTRVGYMLTDPYQSAAVQQWRQDNPQLAQQLPTCITQDRVRSARRDFAKLHDLSAD